MSNHLAGDGKAPTPPPAPPLPPQRQGFVANALARVAQPFGYGSRLPSANGQRPIDPRDSRLSVQRSSRWASGSLLRSLFILPKVPQAPQGSQETNTDIELSLLSSRNTSHKIGLPIAALDISPDRTHAVLAGHNILKTIQVSDSTCAEDFNLRTSIIAYAATHEASGTAIAAKTKEQSRAYDVKWSHGQNDSTIATAAANGQIVVYDINRTGVEIARLHEHSRQVHRLGFNPYQGQLMLSGSQDGTVRLWDLRDLARDRSVTTCQCRRKFPGNSEGIRDIKWSPADGMEFALGTDNGVIQRWDFRNDKTPLLRIRAHENRSCYSIDWHPDGKHLVSGGADKNIKVWDFSSSDRRKKHVWDIRAPQAIHNVRWRPPCWSSDKQSPSRWQCTQIATSYDEQDPRIHIWDFRRPFVPFRTFDRSETPATGLLWHSEDLLWSVGTAGMFTQTDINLLPKTMDHRSPNTLAIAADGQILFFSQKRERRLTSIEDVLEDLHKQNQRRSSTGERLVGSSTVQSSSEEPSLLSSSFKNRNRQHPASLRSTRSSTGTPPSAASTGPVASLDRSLQAINMHQFSQVAAIGYVEGLFDAQAFEYLARHYSIPVVPTEDVKCDLHLILSDALRANGTHAAKTGQHRLSQSWLILGEAVEQELSRRAESGYQQRMHTTSAAAEPLIEQTEEETPDASHKYLLSDFIPPGEKPDYSRPWAASDLFGELFDYHTHKLHDAQVPAYLLLHLGRWLHHSISYERALLTLSHYHGQLTRHELYIKAAELRQLAGPDFPEIAEYGAYGITCGGPFCKTCQKARKGDKREFCERCNQPCGECPICQNQGPISRPDSNGVSEIVEGPTAMEALWTWCQACGHGGHVQCCSVWWELDESEGACPTVGCMCDCMPGARRDEIIRKLEKRSEEAKPGVVTADDWKAPESAAAQRARGLMGGKGPGPSGIAGGTGALSLAAVGRSGSGGKKVRIVIPDEMGRDAAGEGMNGGKTSATVP